MLDEILKKFSALPESEKKEFEESILEGTGHLKFCPNPGPQTQAYFSKADILLYGGEPGGGKLLKLTEKLVTPDGFVKMGDVKVGDTLIDKDGNFCSVTALSAIDPAPELWRFYFDDCSYIDSCIDHQWLTYDAKELSNLLKRSDEWKENRRANRPSRAKSLKTKTQAFYDALLRRNQTIKPEPKPLPTGGVRTTREIIDTLFSGKDGRSNHAIPCCGIPDFSEKELIISPYTLGAWLGDGTSKNGGLTGIDPEIWVRIESDGFEVRHGKGKDAEKSHYIQGLIGKLRELNVLSNKHIPQIYLRGSYEQRLALLQGLMDADGTVARCSGSAEFCNTNKALIDGIYELICSFGWKVNKRSGRAKLYGKDCGEKWTLKFLPTDYVFSLSRKRSIQKIAKRQTTKFRYIVKAEPIDSDAGRCITVNSPSHTYLVGDSFLPTHNTGLLIGLAMNEHHRSMIVRKQFADLQGVIDNAKDIAGSPDGFIGGTRPKYNKPDGGVIHFEGMGSVVGIDTSKQGTPHDFIGIDEGAQLPENAVRMLLGWLRTKKENQRCRMVIASNPPLDTVGDWLVEFFGAWLNTNHPNPAKPGELRYYIINENGESEEVNGLTPVERNGEKYFPHSRTFVPAGIEDNPFIIADEYRRQLQAMPEPYRSILTSGNFMLARKDADFQVIPSAWVHAAQQRWTDRPPNGMAMTAMAFDPAGGGRDSAELAIRYGGWFAPLVSVQGAETADGSASAATIVKHRRDGCPVVIDVGGGYGGSVTMRLKDNQIDANAFDGSKGSTAKTKDGSLAFANKRAEAWWKMREELDPDQEGGSVVMLPPDSELRSDLTTPTWHLASRGIQIESKEEIRKRIGRSPGKGDAVVMALAPANRAVMRAKSNNGEKPRVIMGHENQRRRIR